MNNTTLTNYTIPVSNFQLTKEKVLNWAQRFNTFCFLDNHQYQVLPHSTECLLGVGVKRMIRCDAGQSLAELNSFMKQKPGWLMGHLGYELKNEIEQLSSARPGGMGFPDLFFFEPEALLRLNEKELQVEAGDPESIIKAIHEESANRAAPSFLPVKINNRFSKEEYLSVIRRLQEHIIRGDCYEINFCQEFFAEQATIDPLSVYRQLSAVSPNPFSALYKMNDQWLICASPERFLRKEGSRILSQPIKGTSQRIANDAGRDQFNKEGLRHSAKDRSENVMVVDLVRNDLAKICEEGSVKVDELYGIYSFPQVHQMISTVSGELRAGTTFPEIVRAMFPMGSMTGAPKKRVMELIEQYEKTRRGIFSGALGYITPDGDFDFNVVIRSILFNAATGYLSLPAGSGITFYSDPEQEWQECLWKAEAMRKALKLM